MLKYIKIYLIVVWIYTPCYSKRILTYGIEKYICFISSYRKEIHYRIFISHTPIPNLIRNPMSLISLDGGRISLIKTQKGVIIKRHRNHIINDMTLNIR